MSDKYSERVRALAEEMALVKYAESLIIYSHISHNEYIKRKKEAIELMIPSSGIAMAHMADAVSVALSGWGYEEEVIETYLKEQGLIPYSAQERKPYPCPQELRCHTRNYLDGTRDCNNMGILPQQEGEPNG